MPACPGYFLADGLKLHWTVSVWGGWVLISSMLSAVPCHGTSVKVHIRVSHWNKSSEFTLLTFTTFVPRPKKVKKFFSKFLGHRPDTLPGYWSLLLYKKINFVIQTCAIAHCFCLTKQSNFKKRHHRSKPNSFYEIVTLIPKHVYSHHISILYIYHLLQTHGVP